MSIKLSAKYHQENKERLQKKLMKHIKIFLKKKKKKSNNMTVCSCHVTYAFQSESTLYSCLNVKELLA